MEKKRRPKLVSKDKKRILKSKTRTPSKKKIIVAIFLISFAFFGSFLIFFIMQIGLNTQTPMVVVVSGSMTPNINKGDLLYLQGMDADDIKSGTIEEMDGDVIVFDARGLWLGAPEDPIVHRVVGKQHDGVRWWFRTKGDANSYLDADWIPEERILGVVVGRIPFIGWVKIFLTDSGLLVPLLVILSGLLIISIIWDLIKEEETPKEKRTEKVKIEIKEVEFKRDEFKLEQLEEEKNDVND